MKLMTKIKRAIGVEKSSTRAKKSDTGKAGGYKTSVKRTLKSVANKVKKSVSKAPKSNKSSGRRSGKGK